MAIPQFTMEGILPPFTGSDPGGAPDLMSPYKVSTAAAVNHFSTSDRRKEILAGWLQYRQDLRSIGIVDGFQWLDGSFVEDKSPNDLDLVVFLRRPASHFDDKAFHSLMNSRQDLFDRAALKAKYHLDVLFVDLDGNASVIVVATAYYLQLFSHQRQTFLWKGLIRVQHDDAQDDANLLSGLTSPAAGVAP
jgi:hypothetical protein